MTVSTIKATLHADIHKVWDVVLDVRNYTWHSDLSRTVVVSGKMFIEYTKNGFPTVFTVTDAEQYFKNELTAGTPFTIAGAKELLRLGILTIALPLGSYIAAAIVNGILAAFLSGTWKTHVDQDGVIMLGVMFIVLSIVLKYGAELEGKKENEAYADTDH